MIKRGLSSKTISQLRRLRAADGFSDSEYAFEVSQHLDALDRQRDAQDALKRMKLLQVFINPELFRAVYRDEIEEQKLERTKAMDVSKVDMASVMELLDSIK